MGSRGAGNNSAGFPMPRGFLAFTSFDNGASFLSDDEIGKMIGRVYRVLDEIQRAA